jgi:multiple sugar transport system permease protein
MQETHTATGELWNLAADPISHERKTIGRALMAAASVALAVVLAVQALRAIGTIDRGFENWRPILYVYLLWAVALCVGLVLIRGERGHRALFLLPAVLFTVSMVIFPTAFGLYIAFTDWNLSSQAGRSFSGLDNLRKLSNDKFFWTAMENMVYYALSVFGQYAIAFVLAILLNQDIRGRKFFRVVFLLPFMLSPVAVSWMIGKSMFETRFGPAAMLGRKLGWDNPSFFSDPWTARLSIISMDAWMWIPFMMVLLLAGLQALPGEIMESARVDGATGWKSFWQMTFPLLLPVSVTAVILRIIFELKLADIIITVTAGAPGGATDSVTSFIYREYRDRSNVGYGTALAEFYLIVIIIFMTVLLWLVNKWMRRVT